MMGRFVGLLGRIGNSRSVSCPFSYHIGINLPQVFEYGEESLRVLFRLPIADVRDAGWLDHNSYAISFEACNYFFIQSDLTEYRHQERVEIYRIKQVSADNEDVPSGHKDMGSHPLYVQL